MNFSAFGGPFSGIHQFAAKFGHDTQSGPFSSATSGMNSQDVHGNRYHTTTNHFNQNSTSGSAMQYGQNLSNAYNQPQGEHNNMFSNDHKDALKTKIERDREDAINQQILQNVNQSWQTLANPSNTVDYSSHLLSATLPISIQHFLKYSESIKKESSALNNSTIGNGSTSNGLNGGLKNGISPNLNLALNQVNAMHSHHQHHTSNSISNSSNAATAANNTNNVSNHAAEIIDSVATTTTAVSNGKKKKKKAPKEKKPRPKPGEIRETKALDGSTLYCCPECQMAYPDRSLIEQHVISHAVERRFVCDICNAALKRKDHLTRHKLSHIPDRPHVCNICMKSFKRKEQLTLHIVIHSGEKKHVCQECGKGFYRKDHLRKHTRSHIARRVKSEVSAQSQPAAPATTVSATTTTNGRQAQNSSS
ncbi:zinc finger protein 347 isoform X2 [Sitodiplosis mosellana]|uniref:zinc finger protein 347 isoform X2 n=1 Tax=Sitodiplosis mosellana TaxID=263140 RepID=UPI0024449E5F|nr:zinc finger protein 347 isoform X2 [Sitodiplosis mosellana]